MRRMPRNSGPKGSPRGPAKGPAGAPLAAAPPPKPKARRTWPYAVALVLAWGAIFGAVVFSRFLSELPDVRGLMVTGPSHDITILDDEGQLIARHGLTQGSMVPVADLPAYVPNAFIAIEDR